MVTREEFERLVGRAIDALPVVFLERLENVFVEAAERPSAEILEELGITDPLDLLGYHQGVTRAGQEDPFTGIEPDRIFVYRLPCQEEAAESGLPLEEVVRQTLLHEVGHYFGLSEEEMDEIEEEWYPGEPAAED